jgi:D-psicose/D-tagatose/L-ribulose 3-epimerase
MESVRKTPSSSHQQQESHPISPDAGVRKAGLDRLKWAIEMTATLGGYVLCGPYHSAMGVFSGTGPTADEKSRAADILRQAAEEAARANVTLGIEYLNRFECYFLTTGADAKALVQQVNHPNFRMMYDTFHANMEEKHAAPVIAAVADCTVHVHISENDPGASCLLPTRPLAVAKPTDFAHVTNLGEHHD